MKTPFQNVSRRQFIKSTASASGALALSGVPLLSAEDDDGEAPKHHGKLSDVQHVVLVMMENRSFDHFLGWLPGANGRQAGLSFRDAAGVAHPTHALAPDYQGCGHPDPDHSHPGGLVEYNHGACDGWLRAGTNDLYAIGYYQKNDLAFLGQAAPAWTTCDHYFAATLAETYPNRIYQHAAQTDRLVNTLTPSTLPTIWDRLASAGVAGRYYYSDVPFLALWGGKYLPISQPIGGFFTDCAAGTLPAVSFVDPGFIGQNMGTSNDDHPHADIRNGEVFLNSVYNAVTSSPNWANTVLIVSFDEWGGFFDHVPPTAAAIPPRRSSSWQHRRTARLSRARPRHLAVGAPLIRRARPVRSHLRAQIDRGALAFAATHRARCTCQQPRRRARLRTSESRRAALCRAPRTVWRALPGCGCCPAVESGGRG